MHCSKLLPSLLLAAPVAAQVANVFEIYPDAGGLATTYVTRLDLYTLGGQIYQEFPKTMFRGVGDDGAACKIRGWQINSADENGLSLESYSVEIRKGAAAGGPDLTPSGLLFSSGPATTPGGVGRVSWILSQTWFTPLVVPCEESLFLGMTLAPAPSWTSDGQSVFSAYYYPPATRNVGDNPRKNAPVHSWYVQNGVAQQSTIIASLRMALFAIGPVLNMGGADPGNTKQAGTCYGAGGLYPDISGMPRIDGLDARIRDAGHALGTAQLFLSGGFTPVPGGIGLTSVIGHVWIDPATLVPLNTGSILAGLATIPVISYGRLPSSLLGLKLWFQAATVDTGFTTAVLSNAAAVWF